MRGQKNVAGKGAQRREALLEVVHDVRISRVAAEPEAVGGDRCQTIHIHHIQAMVLVAGLPCPGGAAGRVARREMSGQRQRPDMQGFPIFDDLYVRDLPYRRESAILRVVGS